jgi:hypothetical protein
MAARPILMKLPKLSITRVAEGSSAWAIVGDPRQPLTEALALHVIHLAESAAKVLAEQSETEANQPQGSRH